jgi:hypothetical protein
MASDTQHARTRAHTQRLMALLFVLCAYRVA